jgi:hypothetical protein
LQSPLKESLVFNDAERQLEFEAEGRTHRLSIFEPLLLVAKEDWEATLPKRNLDESFHAKEEKDVAVTTTPKTPASVSR